MRVSQSRPCLHSLSYICFLFCFFLDHLPGDLLILLIFSKTQPFGLLILTFFLFPSASIFVPSIIFYIRLLSLGFLY